MIKHIWTVLCRKSVIDNESNNLSLYDILEQLSISVKPEKETVKKTVKINLPLEYEVVSLWVKQSSKDGFNGEIKLEIINPEGSVVKTFEQPFIIQDNKNRLRSRIRINGFVVDGSGVYLFRISYKEKQEKNFTQISEVPLEVSLKFEVDDNTSK